MIIKLINTKDMGFSIFPSFQKSNQLTLKICDSVFFLIANDQIGIHSQIKTQTSSKHQKYDFDFIKIRGVWIVTGGIYHH